MQTSVVFNLINIIQSANTYIFRVLYVQNFYLHFVTECFEPKFLIGKFSVSQDCSKKFDVTV